MVAITATSTSSPSLQSVLNRSRIERARREADQAETNAQQLRAQADAEERKAQQGQEKVRELTAQGRQTDNTYTAAVKGNTSAVPTQTQDFLVRLYKATSQKFADNGNALKSNSNAGPVVNAQGQATGRILNTSA